MEFLEIRQILTQTFGELPVKENTGVQSQLKVPAEKIEEICFFLRDHEQLYFDFMSCLTGVDNGPEKNTIEVIYHLYSIPFNHYVILNAELDRKAPAIGTVSNVWRTADWHERETYDMFGVKFEGHPDLRRILLPADWEGFPLLKDYKEQEYYHGIKVKY